MPHAVLSRLIVGELRRRAQHPKALYHNLEILVQASSSLPFESAKRDDPFLWTGRTNHRASPILVDAEAEATRPASQAGRHPKAIALHDKFRSQYAEDFSRQTWERIGAQVIPDYPAMSKAAKASGRAELTDRAKGRMKQRKRRALVK
jgi:hypothetical protein